MKHSHECPKCRSGQLWVIQEVCRKSERFSNVVSPVPVTAANFNAHSLKPDEGSAVTIGTFEAWICRSCGLTEWYAKDVNEKLASLSQFPETGVLFYNGPSRGGPYR
jgi:predicted nucleic-acid-binding Zn-ribbon protein